MESLQIDSKYILALKAINYTVKEALQDFLIFNLSEKIGSTWIRGVNLVMSGKLSF